MNNGKKTYTDLPVQPLNKATFPKEHQNIGAAFIRVACWVLNCAKDQRVNEQFMKNNNKDCKRKLT